MLGSVPLPCSKPNVKDLSLVAAAVTFMQVCPGEVVGYVQRMHIDRGLRKCSRYAQGVPHIDLQRRLRDALSEYADYAMTTAQMFYAVTTAAGLLCSINAQLLLLLG